MAINQIIDLNNRTVALIERQDYTAAMKISSRALRLQRTFPNETSEPTSGDEAHDALDQCMLLSTFNDSKSSPAHAFIYNQGILLPPTLTNIASASAILIFNAALAQQLCAETCHNVQLTQLMLLKAKQMYGLASRLRDVVDQNILFQFALVNNTAVIEEKIGDKQASKAYYEFLMVAFMLFVDQKCFQHTRQVRGFLRNMPTQQKDAAAAA